MIYLYLGSLVLGGVLLGSSLVLGGHGDVDTSGGLEHDPGHPDVEVGTADFLLGAFRSLRFWTFFTAFFGLTGLALSGFGLVDSGVLTAFLAGFMGALTGYGAVFAIRKLNQVDESSSLADTREYVGKTARVLVAIGPGRTGKIRLQLRGSTVDVLAVSEDEELATGSEAVIVEMDDAVARVTRYDTEGAPRA